MFTFELSIAVEVGGVPVVPRRVVNRFRVRGFVEGDRGSEGVGVRSAAVDSRRTGQQYTLYHKRLSNNVPSTAAC